MLQVKKLGHSLYGFARKADYFGNFAQIMGYTNEYLANEKKQKRND